MRSALSTGPRLMPQVLQRTRWHGPGRRSRV